MKDPGLILADEILAIPKNEPERIFPEDADAAASLFRALVKLWHPDVCRDSRAGAVMGHLGALYEEARRRVAAGTWQAVDRWMFADRTGHRHEFRFRARRGTELGELLLGREWLLYSAPVRDLALLRRGPGTLRGLRFTNAEMQRQFEPEVPAEAKLIETADRAVLVCKRRRGSVRLADALACFGGTLPPEHVAWLMRRLMDMACLLEFNGVAHANVTPESVFLVPETHDIGLYDPWALATRFGEPLVALSSFAMEHLPGAVLRDRRAAPLLDVDLVKALGRQMLGIRSLAGALAGRLDPQFAAIRPILAWLAAPASGSAQAEYAAWEVAVRAVFPRREFVPLHLTFEQVYPERMV